MGQDLSGSTWARGRDMAGEERDWQEGFHEERISREFSLEPKESRT